MLINQVDQWFKTICEDYKYSEMEVLNSIIEFEDLECASSFSNIVMKLNWIDFTTEQKVRDWLWDNVYIMADRI